MVNRSLVRISWKQVRHLSSSESHWNECKRTATSKLAAGWMRSRALPTSKRTRSVRPVGTAVRTFAIASPCGAIYSPLICQAAFYEMTKSLASPRAGLVGDLFQASVLFEKTTSTAAIKITGHATTRVTPTRMTISRPIDNRLTSVIPMDPAALSGESGRGENREKPL
jgi:hypothetical protein